MREVTLVEVLAIEYHKGDKEYSQYLDSEIEYCVPARDSVVSDISEVVEAREEYKKAKVESEKKRSFVVKYNSLAFEPDVIFTDDCVCFSFRFVGQGFDRDYSGGMEWEAREAGYDYIFENWIDELKKVAAKARGDKVEQGLQVAKESNWVRFVTAWEWTSWRDSYYGEWDSEWSLLGLVDLNQIEKCLIKDF